MMNQISEKQESKTISLYLPTHIAEEMTIESEAVRISRSALILSLWEKYREEKGAEPQGFSKIIALLQSISDRVGVLETQWQRLESLTDQG